MKSTNYFNTLIEVAEDCPTAISEIPPIRKGKPSVASLQFEMLYQNPYSFTSDDIIFSVFATRSGIPTENLAAERLRFFAKGQPCLRTSPLAKRYGWGIHSNQEGKVALVAQESATYQQFVADDLVAKKKAMRSTRK